MGCFSFLGLKITDHTQGKYYYSKVLDRELLVERASIITPTFAKIVWKAENSTMIVIIVRVGDFRNEKGSMLKLYESYRITFLDDERSEIWRYYKASFESKFSIGRVRPSKSIQDSEAYGSAIYEKCKTEISEYGELLNIM